MRFQNFYNFSNTVRDEHSIIEEKFINGSSRSFNRYNDDSDGGSTHSGGLKTISNDFHNLDKQHTTINSPTHTLTTDIYDTQTREDLLWYKTVTLINNHRLVVLKSKYDYKPLSVIDFSLFKTRIESTNAMKNDLVLAIIIEESKFVLEIKFADPKIYKKFINSVRIKSSKHDPFLKFNYEID